MVDEQGRHGLDRHDMIDHAGVGCTPRHAALSYMVELGLSQGQAAMLLDFAHAERAITADTRQDDADGFVATILGKRGKERVYGTARLARRRRTDHSVAAGPLPRSHGSLQERREDGTGFPLVRRHRRGR
jgi:hypothetical protein